MDERLSDEELAEVERLINAKDGDANRELAARWWEVGPRLVREVIDWTPAAFVAKVEALAAELRARLAPGEPAEAGIGASDPNGLRETV